MLTIQGAKQDAEILTIAASETHLLILVMSGWKTDSRGVQEIGVVLGRVSYGKGGA